MLPSSGDASPQPRTMLTAPSLGPTGRGSDPSSDARRSKTPGSEELYRPQFHYTPRRNWMNDPNGLVYHEGTYHLFYQYNPEGATWGHMSWGHATSEDLAYWTHQPVAIPEEGNEMIFSGSAVVDATNVSGVGVGEEASPIVAIYTSGYSSSRDSTDQAQSLAYSTNGGRTWTKYGGNPVLDHPDPDFRDPNVFWYAPDQKWVMAVALPAQCKVQFYASTDFVHWTHLSDFGPAGETRGTWECPVLFQVPVEERPEQSRWVLKVDLNPGAVSGGQYFVGSFDGRTFVPHERAAGDAPYWVDYGPDFYAAIPWNNLPADDDRTLWVGWMSNWTYAEQIPTSPWRGAQTLPRSLHLRIINGAPRLVQRPAEELRLLRGRHVQMEAQPLVPGTTPLAEEGISGRALEFIAVFKLGNAEQVGLNVRVGEHQMTTIGYDTTSQSLFVDRRTSGAVDFHEDFASRDAAPLSLKDGRIKLRVFVDRSSTEVFANDGARVLTHRTFPDPSSDGVSLFATGGTARLIRLDAWSLSSIWPNH